jgi:uncharacterized membrane protein YphA (DoxX/SURF4 family)
MAKFRNIGYWVATGLAALAFALGGALDVARGPDVMAGMAHLGYPAYVATLIGVWKLLGAVAIVAPGFPRIKEWAYAGMFFDLTGASVSHAASGDPLGNVLTPLFVLVIVGVSYALRPESRRLVGSPASERGDAQGLAAARA